MDEQFTTYGTAEVMVANITPEQAAALEPKIKEIKGVPERGLRRDHRTL